MKPDGAANQPQVDAYAADIADYQHTHIYHYSGTHAERKTMRVVLLTVTMMAVEIVAGWLFNSMALFADGWHMSTHAAALGISWLAFVVSRRYALDRRFAFGTWKVEVLGGFVSAVLLGVVALAMLAMSAERLLHPSAIRFDQAIPVAIVGLLVNIVSVFLLTDRPHGHDHAHGGDAPGAPSRHGHGDHHKNLNLRAAYLHVIADAFTSVLAIVALLCGKFMNWIWLDPVMGLIGSVLIGVWTWSLLRETGAVLLDSSADGALAAEIRAAIESDGDTRISDLHVWKVGPGRHACILSVVARSPHALEEYKRRLNGIHELVHVSVEIQGRRDSRPQA